MKRDVILGIVLAGALLLSGCGDKGERSSTDASAPETTVSDAVSTDEDDKVTVVTGLVTKISETEIIVSAGGPGSGSRGKEGGPGNGPGRDRDRREGDRTGRGPRARSLAAKTLKARRISGMFRRKIHRTTGKEAGQLP